MPIKVMRRCAADPMCVEEAIAHVTFSNARTRRWAKSFLSCAFHVEEIRTDNDGLTRGLTVVVRLTQAACLERNRQVWVLAANGLNYAEIGRAFEITRERCRQIVGDIDSQIARQWDRLLGAPIRLDRRHLRLKRRSDLAGSVGALPPL
jgi:hypothetical protein